MHRNSYFPYLKRSAGINVNTSLPPPFLLDNLTITGLGLESVEVPSHVNTPVSRKVVVSNMSIQKSGIGSMV